MKRVKKLAGNRVFHMFSGAVVDQALLSAANFIVGVMLFRLTSNADYGHYVLAQTSLLLLTSLQGAFLSGPMAVLAPQKSGQIRQDFISSVYLLQRAALSRLVLVGVIIVSGLSLAGVILHLHAIYAGTFLLAAWATLNRETLRSILLIHQQPLALLINDAVYVAALLVLAGIAGSLFTPAAPWMVLALAGAAIIGVIPAHRYLAVNPGWSKTITPGVFGQIAPLGAWAAAGAFIYWTFSQGYNFVVAAQLDIAAVAALAAMRQLLMPVNLLTGGIRQLLLPMASGWYQQYGMREVIRRIIMFIAASLFLALIYCAVLWLSSDWIIKNVFNKHIANHKTLLVLWSVIFLLSMVRDLAMTALLVRKQFRMLTGLAAVCSVIGLSICTWGMSTHGTVGALWGLAAAEVINLVGILYFIYQARSAQPFVTTSAAPP